MNNYNGIEQNTTFHPKYYFIFLTLFISFWIISLISAVKIVHFWGITLTGGFIAFPFTMAINTLILEVYGYKNARQAIWSGTILCITYLIFMNVVNIIPASPDWGLNKEFQVILLPQTRVIIASLIAFWSSGFLSNYLLVKLKCSGIDLAPRILISATISIFFDLFLFLSLAFWQTMPLATLYKIFIFAFIKKLVCELLLLPFLWLVIDQIKYKEGYEILEQQTDCTPFSFDNVYNISSFSKIEKEKPLKIRAV